MASYVHRFCRWLSWSIQLVILDQGGGFGEVLTYEFCGKSMKQVLGYIPWLAGYPSPRPRKISIDMEAVVSAWVGCALRSLESGQTTLL